MDNAVTEQMMREEIELSNKKLASVNAEKEEELAGLRREIQGYRDKMILDEDGRGADEQSRKKLEETERELEELRLKLQEAQSRPRPVSTAYFSLHQ